MRAKVYFLAASLCCMLPFMAQGADLDDKSPPGGPPAPVRSVRISPIMIETGFGKLMLCFNIDLGEICVSLQGVTGKIAYQQSVDTSVQSQALFAAPAGSYILTITDTAGNVIKQDIVDIP